MSMNLRRVLRSAPYSRACRSRRFASLTTQQTQEYAEHGALLLPSFIPRPRVERLSAIVHSWIERSRRIGGASSSVDTAAPSTSEPDAFSRHLVLGEGHCAAEPRVTRVTSPVDLDSEMWDLCTGPAADIAEALLGPNVRYHHSKLNLKMAGAAETGVRWHQDIQFWCVIAIHAPWPWPMHIFIRLRNCRRLGRGTAAAHWSAPPRHSPPFSPSLTATALLHYYVCPRRHPPTQAAFQLLSAHCGRATGWG